MSSWLWSNAKQLSGCSLGYLPVWYLCYALYKRSRQVPGKEIFMSQKQVTYGLIVVGILLILASLLVDAVGVGTEGFGAGQIIGLILGVLLAGVGIYRGFLRSPR
jgi:hypothetical protein